MKTPWSLLLIFVSATAIAQTNEVILLGQYGAYEPSRNSPDRVAGLEIYRVLTPAWKVFAGGVVQRRFGVLDRSLGAGAYFTPNRRNSFYANLQVGFSPVVLPGADVSMEYTRVLRRALSGSIAYRYMGFRDASVQIVSTSASVYALSGWVFTTKLFLSTLAGSRTRTGSLLAQVWFEPSQSWSPGISYAVGNEAYRAGAVADITTASSWSTAVSGRFRLSENVKLRLTFEHLNRIGAYRLNTLFTSISFGW
jgi:YaiO family outer membrane protein